MMPFVDPGQMVQRVEKPVLSPGAKLEQMYQNRIELDRLKSLDPKPREQKPTVNDLINLLDSLMGY